MVSDMECKNCKKDTQGCDGESCAFTPTDREASDLMRLLSHYTRYAYANEADLIGEFFTIAGRQDLALDEFYMGSERIRLRIKTRFGSWNGTLKTPVYLEWVHSR